MTATTACIPCPAISEFTAALWVARAFHLVMLGLLVALVIAFGLGKLAFVGVAAVAVLLAYEHSLVRHDDLSKLNAAFFTMNGVISVVFFVFVAGDLLLSADEKVPHSSQRQA